MPPRAVRPRGDMGIAFSEGIDGENQRSKYHKLLKRDVLATQYPDNAALRDLGLSDNVHWMLNNLGGSRPTRTAHFRMFNRSYAINQDQLADLLSFPHGDKFACQHPLESEWESIALDFWQQLTGKTTTDWEGLKATNVQNPSIRYLYHILASNIFGQDNTRNSTSVPTRGPICVRGMIISLALALNLGTKLSTLEPLETPFADLDYCLCMCLIKNKPDDKYFLMISNREVRGVTLPCATRIDVGMSADWTFDLNAPEPDHMEQDAPHTGTHAHITSAFPDSFTGTSSGYQPREEYDYTSTRITLDDLLLRNIHWQWEEIRVSIDQIRQTQLDFVERTELNMGDLIENMNEVHMEVAGMREYMQHMPNPAFGRGGFALHRGCDRHH
ncbi:hypothetical protein KIW84_022878 [Lathyrus oleraceus]|uniref:Arabidopsis retrotransposon Orf1 C-terminal domain-containing protein n=1 Tax=Pisum sativum TaxID=3888 RepID=A0A9D4YHD9_PEA|nr:hypothetical protein KIW84_022878 [Pisum sativum]